MRSRIKHNIFHHIFMVVYSEVINFVWLAVGIALSLGGFALFRFTNEPFLKIAVGLPIFLIGVGHVFIKLHEILIVIFRPKRLEALCVFCKSNEKK